MHFTKEELELLKDGIESNLDILRNLPICWGTAQGQRRAAEIKAYENLHNRLEEGIKNYGKEGS